MRKIANMGTTNPLSLWERVRVRATEGK